MDEQQTEKHRFISLRVKLLVGFTLLFSIVFAGAFYWFYSFATDMAMRQIEEDLVDTLKGAIAGIDGDDLIALAAEGEPREDGLTDAPRFWEQMDWLETVHEIEPRAYPYTYVKADEPNEVLFIADVWAIYDPDKAARFLESYVSKGPLYKGLSGLTLHTRPPGAPYTDKWGSWVSAYAPITNSRGENIGGLGIDFRADYVFQVQQAIRDKVVAAFAVTYITLFVLVFLVSRTLTQPIVALTRAAERIGEGDYEQDLSPLTKGRFPDEMGSLAEVFDIMVGKVYQREQTLIRRVEELKIEIDEVKRRKQVSEIVETDFFQDLQAKARRMRIRHRTEDAPDDEAP